MENFWDKPNKAIEEALYPQKRHVFYSLHDEPMDEIAIGGKFIFIQEAGDGEGKDYRSEVVENPTNFEIALMADEMICTTGDYHHVFLEGCYEDPRSSFDKREDGVRIMRFTMGS